MDHLFYIRIERDELHVKTTITMKEVPSITIYKNTA